ncbi:MAG: leucine-rich repeat protein [Eubacterium sp.]|nr:leucine-rich repeat protein [Eubacterium sp.]
MKKVLSVLLSIALVLTMAAGISITASAKSSNGFKYETKGKSASITGYTGSDTFVVIPEKIGDYKVNSIGDFAFQNNKKIVNVVIPNGVNYIGHWTFGNCSKLKTISIPKSVNDKQDCPINACAFAGCTALKDVYYGGTKAQWKGVVDFAVYALGNNDPLTKVKAHYNAPTFTSLKKVTKGKKSFKATWNKKSSVAGYQIQYSTSKSFTKKTSKKKTVKGAKKTSVTVKKLKGNKKYYVRIRTYKTVSGTKYYSAWSTSKTVTTKK